MNAKKKSKIYYFFPSLTKNGTRVVAGIRVDIYFEIILPWILFSLKKDIVLSPSFIFLLNLTPIFNGFHLYSFFSSLNYYFCVNRKLHKVFFFF